MIINKLSPFLGINLIIDESDLATMAAFLNLTEIDYACIITTGTGSQVVVDGETTGEIGKGILVFWA